MISENATSLRSYRERERQLEKLVNEEMPKNRRDIQAAREFGDLSENFEYESARNTERQLITRMERLRAELVLAKVCDFDAEVDVTDGVVPGCCVTLEYENGDMRTVSILGCWDFDEALNIVSSRGRLAECLYGAQAGDTVSLPDPDFDDAFLEVTVIAIEQLPDAVRAWARGE